MSSGQRCRTEKSAAERRPAIEPSLRSKGLHASALTASIWPIRMKQPPIVKFSNEYIGRIYQRQPSCSIRHLPVSQFATFICEGFSRAVCDVCPFLEQPFHVVHSDRLPETDAIGLKRRHHTIASRGHGRRIGWIV